MPDFNKNEDVLHGIKFPHSLVYKPCDRKEIATPCHLFAKSPIVFDRGPICHTNKEKFSYTTELCLRNVSDDTVSFKIRGVDESKFSFRPSCFGLIQPSEVLKIKVSTNVCLDITWNDIKDEMLQILTTSVILVPFTQKTWTKYQAVVDFWKNFSLSDAEEYVVGSFQPKDDKWGEEESRIERANKEILTGFTYQIGKYLYDMSSWVKGLRHRIYTGSQRMLVKVGCGYFVINEEGENEEEESRDEKSLFCRPDIKRKLERKMLISPPERFILSYMDHLLRVHKIEKESLERARALSYLKSYTFYTLLFLAYIYAFILKYKEYLLLTTPQQITVEETSWVSGVGNMLWNAVCTVGSFFHLYVPNN